MFHHWATSTLCQLGVPHAGLHISWILATRPAVIGLFQFDDPDLIKSWGRKRVPWKHPQWSVKNQDTACIVGIDLSIEQGGGCVPIALLWHYSIQSWAEQTTMSPSVSYLSCELFDRSFKRISLCLVSRIFSLLVSLSNIFNEEWHKQSFNFCKPCPSVCYLS